MHSEANEFYKFYLPGAASPGPSDLLQACVLSVAGDLLGSAFTNIVSILLIDPIIHVLVLVLVPSDFGEESSPITSLE